MARHRCQPPGNRRGGRLGLNRDTESRKALPAEVGQAAHPHVPGLAGLRGVGCGRQCNDPITVRSYRLASLRANSVVRRLVAETTEASAVRPHAEAMTRFRCVSE